MYQLAIFLGGGAGALLRVWLGSLIGRTAGGSFPFGTLAVNLIGCFAIGLLVSLFGRGEGSFVRALLVPGLLGGFTTFSAFSLETALMSERGAYAMLAFYIAASVGGGLLLVLAGQRLGRIF